MSILDKDFDINDEQVAFQVYYYRTFRNYCTVIRRLLSTRRRLTTLLTIPRRISAWGLWQKHNETSTIARQISIKTIDWGRPSRSTYFEPN